jgi:hypothetical protein
MSKVENKCALSDIVVTSILKRKFKQYLTDAGYQDYRSTVFPKYLVVSLVMVLEELLSDCIEYVKKHETNGLYVIDQSMCLMILNKNNKYDVMLKYVKKYNSTVKYQDSVFFNYKKVVDSLESKYGDKLMIDQEARNFISYLLLSLQYELTELSLIMIVYSNRKSLSSDSLLCSYSFLFKELYSKIKLKLDSMVVAKGTDVDADGEAEDDTEGENDETKPVAEEVKEEVEEVQEAEVQEAEVQEAQQVKQVKPAKKPVKAKEEVSTTEPDKVVETRENKKVTKKVLVEKMVEPDDLENDLEQELEKELEPKTKRVVRNKRA